MPSPVQKGAGDGRRERRRALADLRRLLHVEIAALEEELRAAQSTISQLSDAPTD